MVSFPVDRSLDGQRHTSSSKDSWPKKKFFFLIYFWNNFPSLRRYLVSFPYQSYFFFIFFTSSWSFCTDEMQRKLLINRKDAFNCPLCWFPEPQDYPSSALSQVKEKVTKQPVSPFSSSAYKKVFENKTKWRQVPPIYFEAEDMARKETSCFFCWDWQKTKNTAKRWQSSACAADTVEVVLPCLNRTWITSCPSVYLATEQTFPLLFRPV